MNNPVSRTAYYCAGVRMLDAQRPDSLLNDTWAGPFLGDEGLAVFERFRGMSGPNGTTITRARVIDDQVRTRIAADPQLRVVLVGAGFDSRAFRMPGGRWVEIDEAALLTRKEAVAPAASCPNPLERVAIDFATEGLADKLVPYATTESVLVLLEGVLMYLEPPQIAELQAALSLAFPRHTVLCDLLTRRFVERYAVEMQAALAELGTGFRLREDAPERLFTGAGYALREVTSLPLRAAELRRIGAPRWIIRWVMPSFRDGYRCFAFDRG